MSESNGHEDWRERLDRVEASHVQLMTDHEIFRREHAEFQRRYDAQREQDRQEQKARDQALDRRFEATDKRIADLVSSIGRFIASTEQLVEKFGK